MSITAVGSFKYKHYHRLSQGCRLMSCTRAGVNVDYFTLVVRAAGLTATPYALGVDDDREYLDMLANGTSDVGWALKRQESTLLEKVFFTLPVTEVAYGYVANEDRTKIRDSFTAIFFNSSTILFAIFVLSVNSINIVLNSLDFSRIETPAKEKESSFNLMRIVRGVYAVVHSANPVVEMKSTTRASRILLSTYIIAVFFYSLCFQPLILSVLTSDEIRGHTTSSFSDVLDKLEWQGFKALIWPTFRLEVYCQGGECERWNRLKATRTIVAPDSSTMYFARFAQLSNTIGFTSIGNELLRGDVVVFNRPKQELFIADSSINRQPFSFAISRKRHDLVEPFNRAIALTSAIYPRIMARYVPPYGVYSRHVADMVVSPLSLSSFDSVWQFFVICLIAIFTVFVFELIVGCFVRRYRK